MHPLVRDLYKRVLIVGKDYPGSVHLLVPAVSPVIDGASALVRPLPD